MCIRLLEGKLLDYESEVTLSGRARDEAHDESGSESFYSANEGTLIRTLSSSGLSSGVGGCIVTKDSKSEAFEAALYTAVESEQLLEYLETDRPAPTDIQSSR